MPMAATGLGRRFLGDIPARKDEHGRMTLERTRDHLSPFDAKVYAVILNGRNRRLRDPGERRKLILAQLDLAQELVLENFAGMRITKLRPFEGFCAEAGAAATIIGTAIGGIPVSTTHSIAGSIIGVGSARRFSAVRWGIARQIVWAWILTIPVSALIAAVLFLLIAKTF